MKFTQKLIKAAICAALVLAVIPGCSSDDGEAKESTSAATTVATTAPAETEADPEKERAEIKSTYKLSEDELEEFAEENSPGDIVYGGFESKIFQTPVKSDTANLITITPVYSANGISEYLKNYSSVFDLGEGDGSFKSEIGKYTEEFFDNKALLIISFLDKDGGDNYSVRGAWEELVVGNDFEMEKFVIGVKKTDGDITAGHVIVEIDSAFLAIWDTFGIEFYK